MAADRSRRTDATGLAIATGAASLLVGGVLQGFHLITDDGGPPPAKPSIRTSAPPSTESPAAPDRCAQAPVWCRRTN
jgi:hypothetical protein